MMMSSSFLLVVVVVVLLLALVPPPPPPVVVVVFFTSSPVIALVLLFALFVMMVFVRARFWRKILKIPREREKCFRVSLDVCSSSVASFVLPQRSKARRTPLSLSRERERKRKVRESLRSFFFFPRFFVNLSASHFFPFLRFGKTPRGKTKGKLEFPARERRRRR